VKKKASKRRENNEEKGKSIPSAQDYAGKSIEYMYGIPSKI